MSQWSIVVGLGALLLSIGCATTHSRDLGQKTSGGLVPATSIGAEKLAAELTQWDGHPLLVTGEHMILYESKKCPSDRLCDADPSHFVRNGQSLVRIQWGDGLRPKSGTAIRVHATLRCPRGKTESWEVCALADAHWVTDSGDRRANTAVDADVAQIRKLPHQFWNRRVRLVGTRVTTSIGGNQCEQSAAGCITHSFLSTQGALPMQGPIPAAWGSGADRTIEATVWLSHPKLFETGIQLRDIQLIESPTP